MDNILLEYGIIGALLWWAIKEVSKAYKHMREQRNGKGDRADRRIADMEWKQQQREQHETIVEHLEAQTQVLRDIHRTSESTNGKAARIEKDTTLIKDRLDRRPA